MATGQLRPFFTVKCGGEDAATASVKSSDKGVATTTIAKVAGATDAKELQACKVTAKMGTGDAAEEKVIQAGTAAAADKLMGMVHELTWAANTNVSCSDNFIYEVESSGDLTDNSNNKSVFNGFSAKEDSGKKILVLPKTAAAALATAKCTIDETDIMGKPAAHSDDLPTGCESATASTTCWSVNASNGEVTAAKLTVSVSASGTGSWIVKTGSNYIYHVKS